MSERVTTVEELHTLEWRRQAGPSSLSQATFVVFNSLLLFSVCPTNALNEHHNQDDIMETWSKDSED
jgi:hypothetical protein